MIRRSFPVIILIGIHVWLMIFSMCIKLPEDIKFDLYKRVILVIWKTNQEKLEEERLSVRIEKEKHEVELLKPDVLTKYAEAFEKCREVGVSPAAMIPLGTKLGTLPQAFQTKVPRKLSKTIDKQKDDIKSRSLRINYFKAVLLLRQEGLLTNKLDNKELVNLLEIIITKVTPGQQSRSKEVAD